MRGTNSKNGKNYLENNFHWSYEEVQIREKSKPPTQAYLEPLLHLHTKYQSHSSISRRDTSRANLKNVNSQHIGKVYQGRILNQHIEF